MESKNNFNKLKKVFTNTSLLTEKQNDPKTINKFESFIELNKKNFSMIKNIKSAL